jgi:UDP:flavonoid glycosyltransferase YjiC (YdhE family)
MTATAPRILIATFGSLGDLHPFVALAHALKREGFAPVLATSSVYRDFIHSEGLGFAPVRPDVEEIKARLGLDMGGIARRMSQDDGFLFQRLIFPFLCESFEDIQKASEGAAAIVAHGLAFSARLAAEKRGLPLINVILSPLMLYSAYDPPLGARSPFAPAPRSKLAVGYNRVLLWSLSHALALWAAPLRKCRRRAGLPRRHGFDLLLGTKIGAATIGLFSPLLTALQPDHPRGTLIAGHTFHDRFTAAGEPGAEALPEALEAFLARGPAPIVFTLGSFVVHGGAAHYRACIAAARALKCRAVLLAHDEDVDALRREAPPDVFVTGYTPHSLVFPRACVVAHHGGVGAVGQALRAGRPQLVTPFLGDQFDNAERLRRLGVARVLRGDAVTAKALARELAPLLAEGAYPARAKEVAAQVAREDGAEAAAKRIAELLRRESRAERA